MMIERFQQWVAERLSRKLLLALTASTLAISLAFLALFVGYYRSRLIAERATTSAEVNGLLQVALENAMLKRDLAGLQDIVGRLGERPSIRGVMILAPSGEVRFAAPLSRVGQRLDLADPSFCPGCALASAGQVSTTFVDHEALGSVLRSVNPVANREPCTRCHGAVADNPVNGVLVVDYDAGAIRREATTIAAALAGSALIVLVGLAAAIGWVVQRSVLAPVAKLKAASLRLAEGRFDVEVASAGRDELAVLGKVFVGMSQRLHAQQLELARREDFLQSLIDAVPDGIRVIAPDFRTIKVNKAFLTMHGAAPEAPLARLCYAASHGRDEPCVPTLVTCPLHALASRTGSMTFRDVHRRGGGEFAVEVSAAALDVVRDGKPERWIVEAIRDLDRDLHHSHEQRLSEIGQLAAGVAHEIRNPLSSIHLTLQNMRARAHLQCGSELATSLNLMDGEIDRCIQITDRLLKLSTPPAELPELVQIGAVVPEVMSLLAAEAERLGVLVDVRLQGALRVVATDNDVRILVLNLAQNAFHAMPSGGILSVSGLIVGDRVVLSFHDTGVGIAAENLRRIFHPFWSRRADGANGTGLGLPICREIVRRHGGTIEVRSKLGQGSTFVVGLPWAEAIGDAP